MNCDRRNKNFTKSVISTLAERAHFLCSNPTCKKMTTGPHSNDEKSLRSGEAAHIYSAKSKTARHNKDLTDKDIRDIRNGIWLCCDCHKLIDHDESVYPVKLLFQWKKTHEEFVKALRNNKSSGTLRLIQSTIDEETKAMEVLNYLEDRRALYKDFQMEIPSHIYISLQGVRSEILKKKNQVGICFLTTELEKILRAIRSFMDTIYDIDINILKYDNTDLDWIKFENSLSVLRKIIGFIALEISKNYSIQLGSELQKLVPEG